MKRILILLGSIALISQFGCHSSEHHEKHEEHVFQLTSPIRLDTSITKEYVCQVHSIQHIEIRSQERGYLQNIYVNEGQYVKEGQLLFQIMPKIYDAEVDRAKAEASLAKIEYLNTKALADSEVVSSNELAMAEAKLNKAKAELSLAQAHQGFAQVRAPFSGIIDRFHVRKGSLIDEGELLTELSDNSEMWVYFNVPEAEYLDFREQTKKDTTIEVSLLMANNKVFDQTGQFETIEADFNNETGNIAFRATFPNPNHLLRHGETGNILWKTKLNDALIIPQKTTFEILDKIYVFVVGEDGKVESRQVVIEAEMPHLFVIKEGLTTENQILLGGLRKVRNNDIITYEHLDPESVINQLDLYAE
jgi:membrane fusion protein (multidrug efflux system)